MINSFQWGPIVKPDLGLKMTKRQRQSGVLSMAHLWPMHGPCLTQVWPAEFFMMLIPTISLMAHVQTLTCQP